MHQLLRPVLRLPKVPRVGQSLPTNVHPAEATCANRQQAQMPAQPLPHSSHREIPGFV